MYWKQKTKTKLSQLICILLLSQHLFKKDGGFYHRELFGKGEIIGEQWPYCWPKNLLLADEINPPFDVHCLAYLELRNLLTAREVWSKQGDWKTWRFPEGLTQKLMLLFSGGWGEDVMAVINPSNIFGNLQPKALIFGFSLEI